MSRCAMVLMVCCLAATAWAQDGDDAKKALYGKTAFEDLDVLDLFLDLELDNSQAARIQATIAAAAKKATAAEARLDQARQAAQADMFKVRDALLAGKSITAEEVPQWVQLRETENSVGDQLTVIWDTAYQDVLRRLTREQQAMLAPVTDPAQAVEDAAAARIQRQQELAQRQAGIAQTVLNLMETARRTPDPDRFRAAAPQAIAQATAGMTGLPLDHPLQQQLNQFFLTRLIQIYQLQPAPYAQARPVVGTELTRAAMYVVDQTMDTGAGAAEQKIDPARLRQAIRYERSPVLLGEYADQYRDPLAREREGGTREGGDRGGAQPETGARGGGER